MSSTTLSVSIVIPNWNGRDLLAKQLPAVIAAAYDSEIIVVDDASTDDSVEFVKKKYPKIQVIANKNHEGFSSTVNAGVESANGEIVMLLNTDVRPEKKFLTSLITHFSDSMVFAVGCLDKSHEKGKIELRGRGIAEWKKGFFVHSRGKVDKSTTAWVSGGSGAFRKEYWIKLGGMDTLYNPFYWEDIDLSYRALKAGWRLVFESTSIVDHYHEEGKILTEFTSQQVKEIAYRNQFIFIWKNLTDMSLFTEHLLWLPVRLVQAAVSGDKGMWVGFWLALTHLADIAAKRRIENRRETVSDGEVCLS